MKVIEIEGKKFEADDDGKVINGEDGKPKPYVDPADNKDKDKDKDKQTIDPANADLEELAKVNPKLADFMKQAQENSTKLTEKEKADQDAERKRLEEKGEWEKIAKQNEDAAKKAQADLAKSNELLKAYKGTMSEALAALMAEIPDDKKALIPEAFTERQKFEYIIKNAEQLGAKSALTKKGGKVPGNDEEKPTDEAVTMQKRFDELAAKSGKSRVEETEMLDLAKKLKEIKNKNLEQAKSDKK